MTIKLTSKQIEELKAVDVMAPQPEHPDHEIDVRLAQLQNARINLKVSPLVFDRLLKVAEFKGITIEDYCIEVLSDSLEQQIGSPTITGPSSVSGNKVTAKRIIGPTYAVSRG